MIWWVFWCEFWVCLLRQEPQRTARLYRLDDYRVQKKTAWRIA